MFTNGKALTPDKAEFCLRHGMSSVWCSLRGARGNAVRSFPAPVPALVLSRLDFGMDIEKLGRKEKLAVNPGPGGTAWSATL
ncbi:MAG: hypothetical protein AB1916_10350 [Thermodesulfobacteriota bacterium]